MPDTVPNQRIVHIHRDMPQKGCKDFLTVKTENLHNAYRTLRSDRRGATALYLWLILADNRDGYDLALSPKAIETATGLPQSTCKDSVKELINHGFLVQKHPHSNIYDFYEIPQKKTEETQTDSFDF